MISVTPSAAQHLAALIAEKGSEPGVGLRLFVERGGCAGWQYGMKLDREAEGDAVVVEAGAKFIVDGASAAMLRGATVDYCDDLSGAGFRIVNPNAARSCGCGTSFEMADAVRG